MEERISELQQIEAEAIRADKGSVPGYTMTAEDWELFGSESEEEEEPKVRITASEVSAVSKVEKSKDEIKGTKEKTVNKTISKKERKKEAEIERKVEKARKEEEKKR